MPRRIFCQKRHESNHVGTHGRASVSASGIRSLSKRIQPKADRDRRLCPKATATLTFVNYGLIAALTERACPKMHHSRFLSRRFFPGFSAQSQSQQPDANGAARVRVCVKTPRTEPRASASGFFQSRDRDGVHSNAEISPDFRCFPHRRNGYRDIRGCMPEFSHKLVSKRSGDT